MALPASANRVKDSTAPHVNERIEQEIAHNVEICFRDPSCIEQRLEELDREWDVERVLEANASALAFAGVAMGTLVHRAWYGLSAAVTAFLFQHALQGWCPPLPILRRMGFRTARELETERHALKALRGDYEAIADADNPVAACLEAAIRVQDVPDRDHRPRGSYGAGEGRAASDSQRTGQHSGRVPAQVPVPAPGWD